MAHWLLSTIVCVVVGFIVACLPGVFIGTFLVRSLRKQVDESQRKRNRHNALGACGFLVVIGTLLMSPFINGLGTPGGPAVPAVPHPHTILPFFLGISIAASSFVCLLLVFLVQSGFRRFSLVELFSMVTILAVCFGGCHLMGRLGKTQQATNVTISQERVNAKSHQQDESLIKALVRRIESYGAVVSVNKEGDVIGIRFTSEEQCGVAARLVISCSDSPLFLDRHLIVLSFRDCLLRTNDLGYIGRLRSLQSLDLANTNIDDNAIRYMNTLTKLRRLDLSECAVGDFTANGLQEFATLEEVNLIHTNVTAKAILKLQVALPDAEIRGAGAVDRPSSQWTSDDWDYALSKGID